VEFLKDKKKTWKTERKILSFALNARGSMTPFANSIFFWHMLEIRHNMFTTLQMTIARNSFSWEYNLFKWINWLCRIGGFSWNLARTFFGHQGTKSVGDFLYYGYFSCDGDDTRGSANGLMLLLFGSINR